MATTQSSERAALTAQRREPGTRKARPLRRAGLVPGVVYGRATEPIALSVASRELVRILHAKAGEHALITLRIAENGATGATRAAAWEHPVLLHALQHDPVDGRILHVDFHAVSLTERIRIKVAVVLKGEPVGVKQEGGVLEHFLREVEVECLPTEIPQPFEIDVGQLTIGQTVHVSALAAPGNTRILSDPNGVIASVQKPREDKPEEPAAAVTEPEVIREKKPEEGEAPEGEPKAKGEAAEAKAKPEGKGKKA